MVNEMSLSRFGMDLTGTPLVAGGLAVWSEFANIRLQ
jgi:hypothetical protein